MNDVYTYRLPSEAEWEYACRAGTTDNPRDVSPAVAWHSYNSGGRTRPVGSKPANAWGLHDMQGNVWEYCEDRDHDNYEGAPTDGGAWLSLIPGRERNRVVRGGAWYHDSSSSRYSSHWGWYTDEGDDTVGFRVAAIARTK